MWRSFFSLYPANAKLLRSVTPIANGVQALPTQEPVYVKERGLLSDLAKDINQTAEILRSQRADLRKKETARADWISGVSHDIRTPINGIRGMVEIGDRCPEDMARQADCRKKIWEASTCCWSW